MQTMGGFGHHLQGSPVGAGSRNHQPDSLDRQFSWASDLMPHDARSPCDRKIASERRFSLRVQSKIWTLRIWTLRTWCFFGPKIPFCAVDTLWGGAPRTVGQMSRHVDSVLGVRELCRGGGVGGLPGPQNPKSSTIWKQQPLGPWNSFPFPLECTVFPGNEGCGKKELFTAWGKILTFPREGKLTSSRFFASKGIWGRVYSAQRGMVSEGAKRVRTVWENPTTLWKCGLSHLYSGKKKAHKHKLIGPVALGTTSGLSQGQKPTVPGTSPGALSLLCTMEAKFVPGTNPVCPCDNRGDEGRHKKFMY